MLLAVLALLAAAAYANMQRGLRALGLELGFDFLRVEAGFDIAEGPAYSPGDTYARAFWVGVVNTLRVTAVGLVGATVVGVVVGVTRLSSNWLVRSLAAVYVEVVRNVPLLLQLLFWYGAVFLQLPPVRQSITWLGVIHVTQRGIYLPRLVWQDGRPLWEVPVLQGFNFRGGVHLSPEFAALVLGLVIYTGAFIAEVVRGAVQSVPRGQWEAAEALGLGHLQTLRLVVVPQALRIIVPPLTNQYLNLAKNSSLAVAIGFPDLFSVGHTILNQTGQSIPVFVMIMATYLSMSLVTSALMNLYNRRVRLVER
ncbi:amino acid ABC transporter permease [Geochorda subterranea]|uniref:ABC transporter permease subunit n=1 Tax=Geochorda subterranea TaxID=3109564 RepID=A0ABZ1BNT8_9FIRM|nr:ABC transporter permease subunit [Limnochorda sp. LNt]WRP14499.1 ABC transporter permease subunit [Limnochorda sp. LNt]